MLVSKKKQNVTQNRTGSLGICVKAMFENRGEQGKKADFHQQK